MVNSHEKWIQILKFKKEWKGTKLALSTFCNFTMNTEQSKAIYVTEVVLKTPPSAHLYVLKASQTLTRWMWNWRIKSESKHHLILISSFPQSLESYRILVREDRELRLRLLRVYHRAWITLKNCACYNGGQIITQFTLPSTAHIQLALHPSPRLYYWHVDTR